MRTSYFDQSIIRETTGEFVGFAFGYDHCAEHEWGIKGIISSFGIPLLDRKVFGIPKRTITKSVGDCLKFMTNVTLKYSSRGNKEKDKKIDILYFSPWVQKVELKYLLPKFHALHFTTNTPDSAIATAWDDHSFAIAVFEPEHKAYLKEMYNAFLKNDVSIGLSDQSNPFGGSGLTMLIVSKISQEVKDRVYAMDEDYENLTCEFEATGIADKLDKAKKGYYALSPNRITDKWKKEKNTKHDIICWLNPREQNCNNYGWFSIEELEQWAEGKGPIPMTDEQKAKREI